MDNSQKDRLMEGLNVLENMAKQKGTLEIDELRTHLGDIKRLCSKKKLVALWLKKMFLDPSEKQIFMKQASDACGKFKHFEHKLWEAFVRILERPHSRAKISTDNQPDITQPSNVLKVFLNEGLEAFFKAETIPKVCKLSKGQKNFLNSDHVLLNLLLDVLTLHDLIEKEIDEIFENKFFLKIFVTNCSQELLEAQRTNFLELIEHNHMGAFIKYHKFIKTAIDSVETIENFFNIQEEKSERSKWISPEHSRVKSMTMESKENNVNIKKSESEAQIKGNKKGNGSNVESPMLTHINSPNKGREEQKVDSTQILSNSRTTSVNSFKYYDENHSDFTFFIEDREKPSPVKNNDSKAKKDSKKKERTICCNLFGCGAV